MGKSAKDIESFIDGFKMSKQDKVNDDIDYSTKIVAYIDILGVRNLIKGKNPPLHVISTMTEFYRIVESECITRNYSEKIYDWVIMGDGAAIITDNNKLDELLNSIMKIQVQVLLELELTIRGAITAGDVTVLNDGKVIIGPAFIEAFELESEVAIYPRIIVSCKAMDEYKKHKCRFQFLSKDFDQNYVIDFIKALNHSNKDFPSIIQKINVILSEKTSEEKVKNNCRLIQKYGWLYNFVNRVNIKGAN